jgi:hypothetical protein
MAVKRSLLRGTVVLTVLLMSATLGPATATAAQLGDYRWERRPLLVFAPAQSDPRLAETLTRIQATRCDFAARDMVLGQVLATGGSTLDGGTGPSTGLRSDRRYADARQRDSRESEAVLMFRGAEGTTRRVAQSLVAGRATQNRFAERRPGW